MVYNEGIVVRTTQSILALGARSSNKIPGSVVKDVLQIECQHTMFSVVSDKQLMLKLYC
jgi:hypothetical protein